MRRRGYSAMQCALVYVVLSMSLTLGQYYVYGHNIFGWDSMSYPFLVMTTLGLLIWIENRQRIWLIISAISCGLLGAARLPSIVAIVVVGAVVIMMEGGWCRKCLDTALVLLITSAAFLAVVWCVYGSPAEWMAAVRSSVITGHSAKAIISDSLNVLPPVALYWLPGAVALVVLLLSRRRNVIVNAVVAMCLTFGVCYKLTTLATGYMQMPCIILLLSVFFVRRQNRVNGSMFAVVAAMSLCMAFGSDVFPDRVYAAIVGAIVVGLYKPTAMDGFIGRYLLTIGVATVIIGSALGLSYISNFGKCVVYERGHSGRMLLPSHEYDILNGITHPDTTDNIVRSGGLKFPGDFILTNRAGYDRSVFHYEEMTKAEAAEETARLRLYDRIELLPGSGGFATYVIRNLSDDYSIERRSDISTVLVRGKD